MVEWRHFGVSGLAFALLTFITVPERALAQSDPIFQTYPFWTSARDGWTAAIAVGDVNGDGALDLVCGESGSDRLLTVYRNTRSGALTRSPVESWDVNWQPTDVALGDVDGDGDLDLVCATEFRTLLHLNDGGSFRTEPAWTSGRLRTETVALGDIDGDGDLDLVCGTNLITDGSNGSNTMYLNHGGVTVFSATPDWSSGEKNHTNAVALGDIDGDGRLDLVCGNGQSSEPAANTAYLNTGNTFGPVPNWHSSQVRSTIDVALGDVDGDGGLDLVCVNVFDSNAVYLNLAGMFDVTPSSTFGPRTSYSAIDLGDVDVDGDLDAVCAHSSEREVYLNHGGIFSVREDWRSGDSNQTNDVALGDIDGDGLLDLVCGNTNWGDTAYRNIGSVFPDSLTWWLRTESPPQDLALGDIDGDNDLDMLAVVNNLDTLGVGNRIFHFENGRFHTTPDWTFAGGSFGRACALGDIDGDGDPDAVFGSLLSNQPNTIYFNDGGTYPPTPSWSSLTGMNTWSVALGDVDNDGDLDLVFAGSSNEGSIHLYLNHAGNVEQTPAWISAAAGETVGLAWGDVNGDGYLDLVCADEFDPTSLYLNDRGVLPPVPDWVTADANRTVDVALGDIDGDGDLDLACANYGQKDAVYFNDEGEFLSTPSWQSLPNDRTQTVALVDIDGDGDLDLMTNIRLYKNEDGVLSTEFAWTAMAGAGATALADVDSDGDIDFTGAGNFWGLTFIENVKNPVFGGEPTSPTHHTPNNGPGAVVGPVAPIDANTYRVTLTISDVESDPVWIVGEYQFEGSPLWMDAVIGGATTKYGPLATSPTGVAQDLLWDVTTVPFDTREVTLRLRLISNPTRAGRIRYVPSVNMPIGRIVPNRAELTAVTNQIEFPAVTVGDTTWATLRLTNSGTTALRVLSIVPTAGETGVSYDTPFLLAAGASADVPVYFTPRDVGTDPGELEITSDALLVPVVTVGARASIRPLSFVVANLYPGGVIEQGDDLIVSAAMADSVRADSAAVFLRSGGETVFDRLVLTRIPDRLNEQYSGIIPAEFVTSRGIEFFVQVQNGVVVAASELQRLRQRVTNLEFPGTQPAGRYRMVSVPFAIEGTILGALADDLGTHDDTRWRIFGYHTPSARYVELPNDSLYTLEQGRSYWLVSKEARRLDSGPTIGLSTPADEPFPLDLEPGWNMIGNPFNFAIEWDSIRVDSLIMAEAESVLVEPPVGWGLGGGYSPDVDVLQPFEGYWVKNVSGSAVTLRVPPREASAVLPDGSSAAGGARSEGGWRVRIEASSQGAVDDYNYWGFHPDAVAGRDGFDRAEPPASPGRSLSLHFPHPNWREYAGSYRCDIRGTTQPVAAIDAGLAIAGEAEWGNIWYFDVAKSFSDQAAGDAVELVFQGVNEVPEDARVLLADRELGCVVDLRRNERYVFFQAERGRVSRREDARFVVLAGNDAFVEANDDGLPSLLTSTALYQNRPNPFNPTTVIRYDLARSAMVELRIYDARGRLVKVLEEGRKPAGRHESGWNGENDHGERVASGVYFYRLAMPGFTRTRKMVLLK